MGSYLSAETNERTRRHLVRLLVSETWAIGCFLLVLMVQSGFGSHFYWFWLTFVPKVKKMKNLFDFERSKKMVGESFQDMTSVWKHFFRIIAIRRNKRDDHMTLGSIFNVGNVSYWWFFVVQSDLEWFWGENWVKIHKKVKRRNEESELKRHEKIF